MKFMKKLLVLMSEFIRRINFPLVLPSTLKELLTYGNNEILVFSLVACLFCPLLMYFVCRLQIWRQLDS